MLANNMTRQDLLTVTTDARNKIIERLVTKYDVTAAADHARDQVLSDLNAMHLENKSMMRQVNASHDQLWRKITSLEKQLTLIEEQLERLTKVFRSSENVEAMTPTSV